MTELVTAEEAAAIIGHVNAHKVREWMRRGDDPLPSVPRGGVGKYRLVIRSEIDCWLKREFERRRPKPQTTRPRTPLR